MSWYLQHNTMKSSESTLSWGICSPQNLHYGLVARRGRCPALADGVAAVPAFTVMSSRMGLDYFGIFDGFFGAYSANHLVERLHVAVAKEIESELHAKAPRFLEFDGDVEGWWRTIVRAAFRVVDDELVAMVGSNGVAVGAPAVVVLALEEYLVLANRGATCRAVIYRGQEVVQLSPQPYKKKEKEDVHAKGGHVVRYTSNLEENMTTSQAISFKPYFPDPEVLMVKREPEDRFMILATRGFWAHISPAEACNFILTRMRMSQSDMLLAHTLNDRGFQTIVAEELAEQAIFRGSRSNVTVGVILFNTFWDVRRTGTSHK